MDQLTKFNQRTGCNTDALKNRTPGMPTKHLVDKTYPETCTTCDSEISVEHLLLESCQFNEARTKYV
jgi:hypothetical protein